MWDRTQMGQNWGLSHVWHYGGVTCRCASRDGSFCHITGLIHLCHKFTPPTSSGNTQLATALPLAPSLPKTHSCLDEARSRRRHPTSLSRRTYSKPFWGVYPASCRCKPTAESLLASVSCLLYIPSIHLCLSVARGTIKGSLTALAWVSIAASS